MAISLVPLHKHPEHLLESCRLINEEWKRSETARLHSLNSSCDNLPTSLIMLQGNRVIGHAKLSKIPSIQTGCFIESVVIAKDLRRKGFGTILMEKAQDYCKNCLHLDAVYLSTHDQQQFYHKLGYAECAPVSIYGSSVTNAPVYCGKTSLKKSNGTVAPAPPPLPPVPNNFAKKSSKTFMVKLLKS